jgi:BirA family transcriptional regulator, biotin operon repressor / biotin---[acetyl-CoA-carboxylase] ligase
LHCGLIVLATDWPSGEFEPGEFGLSENDADELFFLDPPDLLDMALLRGRLEPKHCSALSRCHSTGSTNTDLLELGRSQSIHNIVHLAEHQSGGRGRRGRMWVSPYARSLALSIGFETSKSIHQMQGLSLAVGAAVCLSLRSAGAAACGLKWPNDVITSEGKLAGILVEHQVRNNVSQFVIGIGVNVALSESEKSSIVQPVVDLRAFGVVADRTSIASGIIQSVQEHVRRFVDGNRSDSIQTFKDLHYFQNQDCVVLLGETVVSGRVVDVARDGSLVMLVDGELRHFISGEVSLRPAST